MTRADGSLENALPPSLRRVAAFLSSTTVLTALLFYFGWSRAYYFYDYLGVESSLLSLTTRDYLQLSVDGLFVPILVAGSIALLALWARTRLTVELDARHRRTAGLATCVVGALLLANAVSRVVVVTPLNDALLVAPLCLLAGALLLLAGIRLQRRASEVGRPASPWSDVGEWGTVVVLAALALFWMANDYSAEVGTTRARQFVTELPTLPDAQLYSARRLGLSAPGVTETACEDPEAAYRYRYDGLRLVLQSGEVYLLLPTQWSRLDGVAFVLPQSKDVRLQFSPAGVVPDPGAPC